MARLKQGEDKLDILFEKYKNGSIEARNKIFERYMPYVEKIAEMYKDLGLDKEDIIQSGYEGLLTAIERFDEKTKSNFSQGVERYIVNSILYALMNHFGMNYYDLKRKPIYDKIELYRKIKLLEMELDKLYGRKPTFEEICFELGDEGITPKDIEQTLLNFGLITLTDSRLHEFNNGVFSTSLTRPTEDELIIKEMWEELTELKRPRMLNSRMIEVLKRRFILEETRDEIGEFFNVTGSAIRQSEFLVRRRIKFSARYLKEYLEEVLDSKESQNPIYKLEQNRKRKENKIK